MITIHSHLDSQCMQKKEADKPYVLRQSGMTSYASCWLFCFCFLNCLQYYIIFYNYVIQTFPMYPLCQSLVTMTTPVRVDNLLCLSLVTLCKSVKAIMNDIILLFVLIVFLKHVFSSQLIDKKRYCMIQQNECIWYPTSSVAIHIQFLTTSLTIIIIM